MFLMMMLLLILLLLLLSMLLMPEVFLSSLVRIDIADIEFAVVVGGDGGGGVVLFMSNQTFVMLC